MSYTRLLILFVSCLLMAACVNQTCEDIRPDPFLNIAFREYTDASRTPRQARDTTVALLDVYAEGLEDVSFIEKAKPTDTIRTRNIRLRLSPLAGQTTFVLETPGTSTAPNRSAITVSYDREPALISQACGYEITYTNLSVVSISPSLDEAIVVVPVVNPIRNEIHIQLYFRP